MYFNATRENKIATFSENTVFYILKVGAWEIFFCYTINLSRVREDQTIKVEIIFDFYEIDLDLAR